MCETLRGLRRVFCSQSALRRLRTGRAICARVGNPLECEVCFNAQSDVMAARVVGIRQEGLNPCRMVPSKRDEGRGTRAAAMTSRARCKVREP